MTLQEIKEQIRKEEEAVIAQRISFAEQDYNYGMNDCKFGIYDKWYRYNHRDEGRAYDAGWDYAFNHCNHPDKINFI